MKTKKNENIKLGKKKKFVATLSVLIGVMITIVVVLPWFVIAIVPVGFCYYRVQVRDSCDDL